MDAVEIPHTYTCR